jgi:hypothetical protein
MKWYFVNGFFLIFLFLLSACSSASPITKMEDIPAPPKAVRSSMVMYHHLPWKIISVTRTSGGPYDDYVMTGPLDYLMEKAIDSFDIDSFYKDSFGKLGWKFSDSQNYLSSWGEFCNGQAWKSGQQVIYIVYCPSANDKIQIENYLFTKK